MAPRKTAKTAETKKAAEAKTKKTTKAATKAKAPAKTKKTAAKKKVVEEEPISSPEQTTPVSEPVASEPAEVQVVEEPKEASPEPLTEPEVQAPEEEPVPEEPVENAEAPVAQSVDEEKINAHRIFITRIAFEATEDDLEEYFSKFGTVHDAYCPRQQNNSNLNKGFGFISFDNEEAIQKVFETVPHIIMGREVIVDRATGQKYHSGAGGVNRRPSGQPLYQRDSYRDPGRYKRHYDGYSDRPDKFPRRDRVDRPFPYQDREPYNPSIPPYRQNAATFDPNKPVSYVFSGSARNESSGDQYAPGTSARPQRERTTPKLFIGRISFDTTVQGLRAYFSQFGEVVDAYIPRDSYNQRSKGFGFLTFANKSSIHAVLEPNTKHVLDGRELVVDYADVYHRRSH
ncbi:RNA recognition motif domain containing protein [Theileria equi strain WA]|uniref:RNA recognition motif domain containing protein n=1 Tax=Theileria equi strain WA TaxID=1537102 RepID=L1LBS2_THEEQ|nr:RNA recognition motif domain containing protein [Theileria equi strain WA]EKX72628.1 RNA recognition motif domain containing protein [Theileria equi strain WA]|eukprot:XP_004832080.1 RNA recognition motif domain containing protein [Theileria equi strain WA]